MVETKENDVAHALTYADNIKAVPCSAAYVYWTDKCLLAMKEIIEEANANESKKDSKGILSIPTGALRTILQLTIDPLLFVALYGGLKTSDLKYFAPGRNAKAFAIAIQYDGFEKDITDGITDWVEGCITEFIERHEVSDSHRETLYELLDNNALFTIKLDIFNLFPWSQFHNGTAKPDNQALGFSITANDVARLLEGKSIFPELPPVMRVVGAYSNSNQAELITPIIETFEEGRFSLVCRLSLETLPTVGKPLIYVDVSKRRWIDSINPKYTTNRSASAYLLDSQKHRAFLFRIEKHKNDKNEWLWQCDDAWQVLADRYNLDRTASVDELFKIRKFEHIRIGISHSFSIDDPNYDVKNRIGAGVLERDRIDVFARIEEALGNIGLVRFDKFKTLKPSRAVLKKDSLAYLDLQSLFSSISDGANSVPTDDDVDTNNNSLESEFDDSEIEDLFKGFDQDWLDFVSGLMEDASSDEKIQEKLVRVDKMFQVNRDLVEETFFNVNEKAPSLLLICQDQKQINVIKLIANKIFGDHVNILTSPLPDDVHGLKKSLPNAKHNSKARIQSRIEIWKKTIGQVSSQHQVDMCLIQADSFYEGAHEDPINKPAAKIAFASIGGIPTQYLANVNTRIRKRNDRLSDYVHRIRSALYDLIFGHYGLVPKIPEKVSQYFKDPIRAPKYLYGVALLKVNERSSSAKGSELAVATRICTQTGIPTVKLCHMDSQLHVSKDWISFSEAIQYITQRYNIGLNIGGKNGQLKRGDVFDAFYKKVLNEAKKDPAIVFIDSTNLQTICSGITNSAMSPKVETDAGNENLRVIRVRPQAPPLLIEKTKDEHLTPTTCRRLFRVNSSLPLYWSLGLPLYTFKRGRSVYRAVQLPGPNGDLKGYSPHLKQAPTPNAVEFTVMSMVEGDDPDNLARFTESLRTEILQANFAKWVKMPSPLFITNKLKEYMSM